MFDLSKEFEVFYDNYTVLPQDIKNELRNKKNINISRLKSGLEEYNEENKTEYCILDIKEQGSVAMSTVTQNDRNDYDIDIAIIFEEENIGESIGTIKIKNIITDALKKKCTNFKKEPEALTNCVRIEYKDGYHIDFAVYKKVNDKYYHAGSSWQERDPMAINNWFNDEIKNKGDKLRCIIRLSKMFCKSRESWQMPGGLIQTVLCVECFQEYERLDECFYYTMKKIRDRLETDIEVYNPTDATKSLLLKQKDIDKMDNWKRRLNDKLKKLEFINDSKCTKKQAYDLWYSFFNHDYWQYSEKTFVESNKNMSSIKCAEEFIRDKYPVDIQYSAILDCNVEANGFRPCLLSALTKNGKWLPHNRKLTFFVTTNVPPPYDVLWKVKNIGWEAERRNCIRGEIIKSNCLNNRRCEHTDFWGPHFVECYIIKGDNCVAIARTNVPIDDK